MNNFLIILSILVIPIIILLFIRQLKRKKVYYSFTFLDRFKSQSLKQILLKVLQLFYDIIFDLLIAIVLALIFSNLIININTSNKVAFVIDASYSMLKPDINGITPFEKAIAYYYEKKNNYKSYDLYAGIFDIKKCKSIILPLNDMKNIINPKIFVTEFLKKYPIFDFDPDIFLYNNKINRYKKAFFITDLFPYELSHNLQTNYEIIELGKVDKDFIYPISILYNPIDDTTYCYFLKSTSNFLPQVKIYDANKLFIDANDKVKVSFNNENSCIIETKEKSLIKVTLYNQSYYMDLAKIPVILKSYGKYPELINEILKNHFDYEKEILKFKERGFQFEKNKLPLLLFYQGETLASYLKKDKRNELDTVINIFFSSGPSDMIFDPDLTGGFIIGTDKESILKNIDELYKKFHLQFSNLFTFSTKNISILPVIISSNFIYKPQTIMLFSIITEVLRINMKDLYSNYNFINYGFNKETDLFAFNLKEFTDKYNGKKLFTNSSSDNTNYKIKNGNISKNLIYNTETYFEKNLKKATIIERNNTSILYKKGNKIFYKNINLDEIYPYKYLQNIVLIRKQNIPISYMIILAFLFLSKFITFLILKTK